MELLRYVDSTRMWVFFLVLPVVRIIAFWVPAMYGNYQIGRRDMEGDVEVRTDRDNVYV